MSRISWVMRGKKAFWAEYNVLGAIVQGYRQRNEHSEWRRIVNKNENVTPTNQTDKEFLSLRRT